MVPVPEWGDGPSWVQGVAEAGALWLALRGRRQAQAIDWGNVPQEALGPLRGGTAARTLEDSPAIAELVYAE